MEQIGEHDIEQMKEKRTEGGPRISLERFRSLTKGKTRMLLVLGLVVAIFLMSFYVRSLPARFNELQALDPFYLYRLGQYASDNGFQLPEVDTFRDHPFGSIPLKDEFSVPIYLPVFMRAIFVPAMPFLQFAIMYPALMGALATIVMFFIGRELYNERAGLFAAFFLGMMPAFITRTSAGFFDKEPTFGFFMLLAVFFFVAAYKRDSWKMGILSGITLGLANGSSGIGVYIYIFFFLFAGILLLINKHKGLINSYGITVVLAIIVQLILPKGNLDSTFFMAFVGVFVLLLLREGAERFKLVKDKDLKFFIPALLVVMGVGLLIVGIFSPEVYQRVDGLVSVVFVLNPSPIGYTVAEQQPGTFGSIAGVTGLQYAGQAVPQLGFLTSSYAFGAESIHGIFSVLTFALLGIIALLYRLGWKGLIKNFAGVKREYLILFLPLIWFIASIWGVFLFIRLVFIFGPPAALMAGLFLAWAIVQLERLGRFERLKPAFKYLPFYLAVFVGLLVFVHSVNAITYTNQLGPSICFPDPQILIDGQRCLDINEDGTITFAQGQPWYEAMGFLRELPYPKNILTWWDFGHWFHARGETPSAADGGKGPRFETAQWYTASVERWDEFRPFVEDRHQVSHIIQDYTLPGKYGAISAIATNGEGTVGMQQFGRGEQFQQGNVTIQEFTSGEVAIWLPLRNDGNLAGSPMFLVSQGGQYVQNAFINDICSTQGIVRIEERTPSIGGCVAISPQGLFYIPEVAKNSIFTSLQFMNGAGLPVNKVFDNNFVQIYERTDR